ncbi:hypothetical protein Ciccas_013820 [Cichlidogyrus casuarinus]|uniref:PiggyBac transposable element-derived protein domain-containing protein n=1 Tax=Cichlidogyrus casuarinus TaxID=1844966 RepID=A0ABD2PLW2_9PLAT
MMPSEQNLLLGYLDNMQDFIRESYKNSEVSSIFLSHCMTHQMDIFVQSDELQLLHHCVNVYSDILSSSELILAKRRFVVMWERMLHSYGLFTNASRAHQKRISSARERTPRPRYVDSVQMQRKGLNRCTICECRIHGMILICPNCNHCGHVDHML